MKRVRIPKKRRNIGKRNFFKKTILLAIREEEKEETIMSKSARYVWI
jgi:hypothetical protein